MTDKKEATPEKKEVKKATKKKATEKKEARKVIRNFWIRGVGHCYIGDEATPALIKSVKAKGLDESKYFG